MLHNCTARNCFFLGVFRCSLWHILSKILWPIGHTAWNIAAEWFGRSPFGPGVPEVCPPKVVGKILPMSGNNAPDYCLRGGKWCFRTSLPLPQALRLVVAVIPSTASRRLWARAWSNQDPCLPKAIPNPMGYDKPF